MDSEAIKSVFNLKINRREFFFAEAKKFLFPGFLSAKEKPSGAIFPRLFARGQKGCAGMPERSWTGLQKPFFKKERLAKERIRSADSHAVSRVRGFNSHSPLLKNTL